VDMRSPECRTAWFRQVDRQRAVVSVFGPQSDHPWCSTARRSRPRSVDEALPFRLRRLVPLGQRYTRRGRSQSGTQRLLDRREHGRSPLTPNGMTVEVGVELDVLRPAFAAAEPPVRRPPVRRPKPTPEDIESLMDWHRAVVPARLALDQQIRALAAEILDRSDDTRHDAGISLVGSSDKNRQ
jgi:hypothetical protein